MPQQTPTPAIAHSSCTGEVPNGAPDWVTVELITYTIEVWQPYYRDRLTADDALEMLLNAGQLLRVLADSPSDDRE